MSNKYTLPTDPTIDSYNLRGWKAVQLRLRPTAEQSRHLITFAIMLVAITIAYQFQLTRLLLYPFELISTVFHEFGHALMTVLTGGRVAGIEINPNESGVTRFVGGARCLILPAGYCGSSLAGAALLVLSFGERSAKVATGGTVMVLLATIYWSATLFTLLSASFMICSLAVVYYYRQSYLSKVILFMGVMGSLTSLLSIFSHLVSNTIEGSDAVEFARHCSVLVPSMVYGGCWLVVSLLLISGSMALGLYLYR